MKRIALIVGIGLSSGAYADEVFERAHEGHEIGNGGDAVVCRTDQGEILSAELLDFYEARTYRNIQVDLGGIDLDASQKVELALSRIGKFSPQRHAQYESWYETFAEESVTIPGVDLPDVNDSDHLYYPRGCAVEQLAIQKDPETNLDPRYVISQDIWEHLDADSQAGLILHELIYRDFIKLGHENSKKARLFTSIVSSNKLDVGGLPDYTDYLVQSGGKWTDIKRMRFDLTQRINFYRDGTLNTGYLLEPDNISLPHVSTSVLLGVEGQIGFHPNGRLRFAKTKGDSGHIVPVFPQMWMVLKGYVNFHPNGWFKSLRARASTHLQFASEGQYQFWISDAATGFWDQPDPDFPGDGYVTLDFHENKSLHRCQACQGWARVDDFTINIGGHGETEHDWTVWLEETGKLASGKLANHTAIEVNGQTLTLQGGTRVAFDEEERIYGGTLLSDTEFSAQDRTFMALGEPCRVLWDDGHLMRVVLAREAELLQVDGSIRVLPAGYQVEFDAAGFVVNAWDEPYCLR